MRQNNALIYTALVSLGVHEAAAESLAKGYDPAEEISPEVYARGAAEAFFYGKGSFPKAELRNGRGLSPVLTELQRNTAYRLGQIMNDTRRTNPPYGVEQNEFTAQLDPQLVSAVDALAKLFRIKVRFGNLGENNGLYHADTGLIELDTAPQHRGASNAFLFSVSHELGHAVKDRIGSKGWNEFAQYAVKVKGGEIAITEKQKSDNAYSLYDAAREEVVCDFIGELLSEQKTLDTFCESIKGGEIKTETARGIVAAWHKLLNIFKGKTAQQTDAETAALVKRVQEQFGADIETAENAVKKLQQALSAALQTEKNTAGGSVQSNAVSFSKKENGINPESTEAERYAILSRVQLSPANVNYENLSNVNLDDYNTRRKSDVEKGIKRLADVLGVSGVDLQNSYIDFPFQYSKASILKSLHHQLEYGGSYQDYVKAMSCFNELIANAVPIETHLDKKVGTQRENPDLKQVYVLVSAFRDGNSVVPVQFEIKEFYSAKSGLYLTVTLTKIDTGVLEETPADITAGDTSPLFPMSTYSLRSIFENVNPADGRFLKYVPDRFLNKAQLEAKHEALRKQTAEYASYAVETPEKSRTAATKKSIKDKQQDIDNAEGDLTLTKVGSTDIDGVTERSQNTPEERTALPNHGTQNDLSHEQRSDQEQPTVHSLLMETDASKVKNATERKYLKEYQETANRQLAEQQKLDKLQAELDALPNAKRQTSSARFLRDELIKTKNRLQICQSIQTRLETDSPLTYLIHREIKLRLAETPQKAIAEKMKYDTIVAELKVAGIIPQNAIVHIPPMVVDTTTLSFDDAHINGDRGHNVTQEQALHWIRKAKISVNVWNGRFERFYSERGASYVDFVKDSVRTAYSAEEFDEKTKKLMEVLKKNGY